MLVVVGGVGVGFYLLVDLFEGGGNGVVVVVVVGVGYIVYGVVGGYGEVYLVG